jgi:hypothetical protein
MRTGLCTERVFAEHAMAPCDAEGGTTHLRNVDERATAGGGGSETGGRKSGGRMMQSVSPRARLSLVIVAVGYLAAMLTSHIIIISPRFAYRGLDFNPVSVGMLAMASAIAILPTTWMPVHSNRPSTLSYFVIYFLLYVPACVVPICTLEYGAERYLPFLICIAVCFWGLARIYQFDLLRLPAARFPAELFWTALIIASVAISIAVISRFGMNFRLPSLRAEIYEVRHEYHDAVGGSLLVYFIMFQAKVLAPLFVISGLHSRKPALVALGISSQLLIFVNAGVKTVLFSSFFIIGLYFVLKFSRRKLFLSIGLVLISVIGGARIADKLLDEEGIYFSSIFVRRLILTPGLLSGYYVDFFSVNPKANYGHSVLEGYVDYPYMTTPARLIASEYFDTEVTNSNANFWADGFSNFGLPGVVLATVVLGIVLWIYDSIAMDVDQRVATLLLAMPSMALVNSAIFTVLLTHGLIFAMILLHSMPRRCQALRARGKAPQSKLDFRMQLNARSRS